MRECELLGWTEGGETGGRKGAEGRVDEETDRECWWLLIDRVGRI